MKQAYQEYQTARQDVSAHKTEEWRMALNFLRQTNKNLFLDISRRMLNFLSWSGIQEAETDSPEIARRAEGTDGGLSGRRQPSLSDALYPLSPTS